MFITVLLLYSSKVAEATQMPNKQEVLQEMVVLNRIHNYKIYLKTCSNTENTWTLWLNHSKTHRKLEKEYSEMVIIDILQLAGSRSVFF